MLQRRDVLVVGQVKGTRIFLQAFIVVGNSAHEEAHGLGSVARSPFLAGLL